MFDPWVGKILWSRDRLPTLVFLGFPCGSAGKESACNAGDLGLNLGWEDPLEKGKATHSSILACRIPWTVDRQAPLSMGILQARILEWVAMPSSRGSSQPRDQTQVSHIAGEFFTV